MKKKSFIETPAKGIRRLNFPKRGLKVFALSDAGTLNFEVAGEENEFVRSLDGGIGITDTVDSLRAFEVNGNCLQVLTFHPALFSFSLEKGSVKFCKTLPNGTSKVVFELPLDAPSFFLMNDRRRCIEVWLPIKG